MDLNSRHGWDGSGGTNNRVKIEFYYSNGNMGCYHNYWSGFGTGWYNVEGCYGNSYRVDYVVVKIFGDDAMGIDQCGFYSKRGHDIGWTQRRWFGQENHGSYWISSDANDTVGNRRPCKIFMMAGANAGQNYHCGTMNSVWGLDGLVVWGAY